MPISIMFPKLLQDKSMSLDLSRQHATENRSNTSANRVGQSTVRRRRVQTDFFGVMQDILGRHAHAFDQTSLETTRTDPFCPKLAQRFEPLFAILGNQRLLMVFELAAPAVA